MGEISVGDFTEQFACFPVGARVEDLESVWRAELRKLVGGAASVALPHDPRFAWIIYREDKDCFVQQVLTLDGDFRRKLSTRITITEDRARVSEWSTDVSAIETFLET